MARAVGCAVNYLKVLHCQALSTTFETTEATQLHWIVSSIDLVLLAVQSITLRYSTAKHFETTFETTEATQLHLCVLFVQAYI